MKNAKILLILLAASAMMAGCVKEEFPQNGSATSDQVKESLDATVAGLHSFMNKYNLVNTGHWDFGYPALMLQRDFLGQDLTTVRMYNQFGAWKQVNNLGPTYTYVQFPWRWYYRQIMSANGVIALVPDVSAVSDSDRWSKGTAYVYRAMCYFDLARLYLMGRYADSPEGLTVPIVTEATTMEEARNNPRAAASKVYELILADLTAAAECLKDYKRSEKIRPDASVVGGMFARVYLEMGNWAKAAEYAAAAAAGYAPLTESQWRSRTTGFNTPEGNKSWMWCATTTSNDTVVKTGIVCWAAHMCNEAYYGYAGAGEYIMIDAHLYSLIGKNDWRRNSWVDPTGQQPVDSDFFSAVKVYGEDGKVKSGDIPAYASFKFRTGSGEFYDYSVGNSLSVPLMRMEEMKLIQIEAKGRLNVADGVAALNEFVKTRDADYESKATTLDQFIEDLWTQRRIELWGEGFGTLDLKRLNKPVIRSYAGSNHEEAVRYNTTEQPVWLNYVITRTEVNSNKGLGANNPDTGRPTISPEYKW